MAPFGDAEFRRRVLLQLGPGKASSRSVVLHVESQPLIDSADLRAPCLRAMRGCNGVIVLLDGTSTIQGLNVGDAPVLELEVMFAALSGLPIVVIDASNGQDRLLLLLGSSFFVQNGERPVKVMRLAAMKHDEDVRDAAADAISAACEHDFSSLSAFHAPSGWESLFRARPDRFKRFSEDGGNFPFSSSGLDIGAFSSTHVDLCLERAEALHGFQKLDALVATWDAIRALSHSPWAASSSHRIRLQWLRAMFLWGGLTHWLGLIGHSSAAAIMCALSGLHLANSSTMSATLDGSDLSAVGFYNRLASAYYSLSKIVGSAGVTDTLRQTGIHYATVGLSQTRAQRSQASLLGIRASLFSAVNQTEAISDAQECIAKHLIASRGNTMDEGYAHGLIRLGVVTMSGTLSNNSRLVNEKAFSHLREGCGILESLASSGQAIDKGQLVMGLKAIVRNRIDSSRLEEANDSLARALTLAVDIDAVDQVRQLRSLQSELNTRLET